MSLILDALKKLEQEKKSRTRQVELRPAVTARKNSASKASWRPSMLLIAVFILAVAGTMGITKIFSYRSLPLVSAPKSVKVETEAAPAPTPLVSPSSPDETVRPQPTTPVVAIPPVMKTPQPAPKRSRNVTPSTNIPFPEDFKVTGIAWLEERAARRAVINGYLLREGETMSGAKLIEIRQDQVRFSQNGQTFTVFIASSNQ
jgi:general secretion pathway protein B